MSANASLSRQSNRRIIAIAAVVFVFDQFTKWLVLNLLEKGDEKILIPGFFKFVHCHTCAWPSA